MCGLRVYLNTLNSVDSIYIHMNTHARICTHIMMDLESAMYTRWTHGYIHTCTCTHTQMHGM